jgi:hypothetical protein
MSHTSKISQLKAALEGGEVLTPQSAGTRFKMQHNTFHRCLHALKKRHGFIIGRKEIAHPFGNYNIYWLEGRPT